MRTATLGSVPCLPSNIDRFLSPQPIAVRRGASENRQKLTATNLELEKGGTLRRDNQDENVGHDPAIRTAIVVARGSITSRELPKWVHRFLPPLRFAARETRSATGRGPPMDYLDNPLPASIAGADHVPAKKCGFRPAFTDAWPSRSLTPRTFAGSWVDQSVAAARRKRCRLTGKPRALRVRRRTLL